MIEIITGYININNIIVIQDMHGKQYNDIWTQYTPATIIDFDKDKVIN